MKVGIRRMEVQYSSFLNSALGVVSSQLHVMISFISGGIPHYPLIGRLGGGVSLEKSKSLFPKGITITRVSRE